MKSREYIEKKVEKLEDLRRQLLKEYQDKLDNDYEDEVLWQYISTKNIEIWTLKDILKEAASLREAGNIVLVSKMNKNKKFQKEGLEKQGYTEFKEFYREALK